MRECKDDTHYILKQIESVKALSHSNQLQIADLKNELKSVKKDLSKPTFWQVALDKVIKVPALVSVFVLFSYGAITLQSVEQHVNHQAIDRRK